MSIELPASAITRQLPSVTAPANERTVSQAIALPLGASHFRVDLDTSGWPADTDAKIGADFSLDGGASWSESHWITTTDASRAAVENTCSIGLHWNTPNSSTNVMVRAGIEPSKAMAIAGTVSVW